MRNLLIVMRNLLIALLLISKMGFVFGQVIENELYFLTKIKEGLKSKRVGSWDQSGGNADGIAGIKDNEKVTMMDVKGAGVINHIMITLAPVGDKVNRNDVIIRMYWDGNDFPSVEAPIGPFFGNGWEESYDFISAPLAVTPTMGKGYVSYFAMPFNNGAKIEVENQSGATITIFYFNIDYVEMDKLPNDCGRFHAWYNREVTTSGEEEGENEWGLLGEPGKNLSGEGNYLFADIKGKGHFVGVNYYVNCPTTMWYGEGDEMIFIDGETTPSIVGTGTEDFFNTAWCPKDAFQHPYFGYPRINEESGWLGRTHVFRFFVTDPIYFEKSCKFTIEHGHNNNLALDLASVAYWYQQNASSLPRTFSKEERKPMRKINSSDIHLWRNSWRKEKGNKPDLWGNEKN